MLIKFLWFNILFLQAYNNALAALATWFPSNPDFLQEKTLQSAHLSVSPLYYITKNDRTKNTRVTFLKRRKHVP
jgi:hypothetical protein